jgi:hypothetical protein
MRDDERRYRDALAQIAEAARAALDGDDGDDGEEDVDGGEQGEYDGADWGEEPYGDDEDGGGHDEYDGHDHGRVRAHGCTIRHLPRKLLVEAARRAVRINPVNAPASGPVGRAARGMAATRLSIAVETAKYWGPQPRTLSVSFLENTPADLRRRIVQHMNAWSDRCGIRFAETSGTGHVRITRGPGGYWSYLGTDITLIRQNEPTLGLTGFTMTTSEEEFRRVVRHEAGHTLGFPHEHMRRELVARIDPARAYAYFWRTERWDRKEVDQQVLTPLDDRSIMGTPPDEDSIMCYQLPGEVTRDRRPIRGGADINESDFRFAARIYPRPGRAPAAPGYRGDDWEQRFGVD